MRTGRLKTIVAATALVATSLAAVPVASAALARPPVVQRDANGREVFAISDNGRFVLTTQQFDGGAYKRIDLVTRTAVTWTFSAFHAVLTADGSAMFFQTPDKLVPADTNGAFDVYKYVFATKAFTRIALTGLPAGWEMVLEDINATGSVLAFAGGSGVLALASVWIFDDPTNVWRRLDAVGVLAKDNRRQSSDIVLNSTGRVAAFTTYVVAGAYSEVWAYNWSSNSVTRVSVRTNGTGLTNGWAEAPSISPDGNVVSFRASATGLVAGISTVKWRVYVRNRVTRTTVMMTEKESRGLVGRATYTGPQLMANGTMLTMLEQRPTSYAGQPSPVLMPQPVVYVVATKQNVILNKTTTNTNPNAESQVVFGAAAAKKIAFTSAASNFTPVTGGKQGPMRVFVSSPA